MAGASKQDDKDFCVRTLAETASLLALLMDQIDRINALSLGVGREIEGGRHELIDRPLREQRHLTEVDQFGGAFAGDVHTEQALAAGIRATVANRTAGIHSDGGLATHRP